MELFSAEFFSALFAIVVIDLVLAGDNAIVIALPAWAQRWGCYCSPPADGNCNR